MPGEKQVGIVSNVISRFFRIAPQPAKRLEEAGFIIETNQGFLKEQEIR